jgi:hypothetical protein
MPSHRLLLALCIFLSVLFPQFASSECTKLAAFVDARNRDLDPKKQFEVAIENGRAVILDTNTKTKRYFNPETTSLSRFPFYKAWPLNSREAHDVIWSPHGNLLIVTTFVPRKMTKEEKQSAQRSLSKFTSFVLDRNNGFKLLFSFQGFVKDFIDGGAKFIASLENDLHSLVIFDSHTGQFGESFKHLRPEDQADIQEHHIIYSEYQMIEALEKENKLVTVFFVGANEKGDHYVKPTNWHRYYLYIWNLKTGSLIDRFLLSGTPKPLEKRLSFPQEFLRAGLHRLGIGRISQSMFTYIRELLSTDP